MDGGATAAAAPPVTVDLRQDSAAVVELTGNLHHLPCSIKYNGSTAISHFFKPKLTGVQVDGLNVEEAHFRGRKLHGTTIDVPHGYSGFVLGKKCSSEDESDCCWVTNAKFKNFRAWNHDSMPSKDDAFFRAFHWFPVAETLHKPVTAEELESMSMND